MPSPNGQSGVAGATGSSRPMTLAQVLALVEQQRQAGRPDVAEKLCRQILQVTPDQAEMLQALGVIVYQSGRTAEGIELVRQAIAANGAIAAFHANLCEMCRLAGRFDEAVAAGRQAIAIAPDLAQAHNNLGIAYFDRGEYDAAGSSYRRALALAPGLAEVHSNLGNVLQAQGRLAEAAEAHRRAIALKPDYADGFSNLGTVLRLMRRYAEAEACYRQALALKPQHPAILDSLALCIIPQRRLDEAQALLARSAELDPRNAQTFVLLATVLSKRKLHDEARLACERALALQPDHAEALNVLGCIAFDEGRVEDSVRCHRRALELAPGLAHAHNNLGNALKAVGRLDDARAAYLGALAADPRLASAHLGLGDLRKLEPGDPAVAAMERLAGTIEALDPQEQAHLHFALGKAYADVEQHERSFHHLLQGNAIKRRQIDYDETAMLRLFDRVRDAFTSELLSSRKGTGDPSDVPVLIVGMPRSGTTLIEQILASHPQVFAAGELNDLREVIAAHCDLAAVPASYPECVRELSAEVLRRIGTAYTDRLRRRAPEAARVTDKMPGNFFHLGLVHLAVPNARIILAGRDPVDTCLSCFARTFGDEQQFSYDLAELGRYYGAYESLMAHWRAVLPPGAMLEVQYEEVVEDLEGQARRIVAHCGLEWDDACLRFHETERPVRTASASQVRQPIYRSAVGRWRPYRQWLRPLLDELGTWTDVR